MVRLVGKELVAGEEQKMQQNSVCQYEEMRRKRQESQRDRQ